MTRPIFLVAAAIALLAACGDSIEERAATGGLGGAAVGTVIGGPVAGAAVGATVGAVSD